MNESTERKIGKLLERLGLTWCDVCRLFKRERNDERCKICKRSKCLKDNFECYDTALKFLDYILSQGDNNEREA